MSNRSVIFSRAESSSLVARIEVCIEERFLVDIEEGEATRQLCEGVLHLLGIAEALLKQRGQCVVIQFL